MNNHQHLGFYCSSISWGGLEMNFVRYATWMRELGWKVTLCCVENSRIHEAAKKEGFEPVLVRRNRKYFDLSAASRLARITEEAAIDVWWFRDTRDFSLMAWTKERSKRPVKILYQQAMQFGVSKKDFFHTWRFKRVDAWVSTLEFLADQVRMMTRFPHERIHVVPLGVDEKKLIEPDLRPTDARAALSLPLHDSIVGIIGRLDPLKGQHHAIEALYKVHLKGEKCHLLIFGESTLHEGNAYAEKLHAMVKEYGLQAYVHFRPFSERVYPFYRAADIFLMCSKGETFGTVTIEAMATGCAVIATKSSGSPEILCEGKCGALFEPGDTDQLSRHILTMVKDSGIRMFYAQNAREAFHKKFSREASLAGMQQVLNQLRDE